MLLSEMFGVERETDFMIKGYSLIFRISLYTDGSDKTYERLVSVDEKGCVYTLSPGAAYCAISIAPSGIIHLPPPLTDEQREQLKAIWTLGGRWLAKDANLCVYAYSVEPEKNRIWNHWVPINYNGNIARFPIYRDLDVCSLVSWSDAEPYDISKALEIKR